MDLSPYYRTNIKQSVDDDRDMILTSFQEIIKRKARVGLRLVNYYKGLPLSYPATLVEVYRGILELDVHKQQAVAMERNGQSFMKCDFFDSPILARAQNINLRSMTASLSHFTFVQIMAENRASLRLELDTPTDAEATGEGTTITGKVLELSLGGFSMRSTKHCDLPKGTEVSIKVMVPNLLQNTMNQLEVKGALAGLSREDNWDICRFSIVSDVQSETILSRFIFQRQVEIIRELKESD